MVLRTATSAATAFLPDVLLGGGGGVLVLPGPAFLGVLRRSAFASDAFAKRMLSAGVLAPFHDDGVFFAGRLRSAFSSFAVSFPSPFLFLVPLIELLVSVEKEGSAFLSLALVMWMSVVLRLSSLKASALLKMLGVFMDTRWSFSLTFSCFFLVLPIASSGSGGWERKSWGEKWRDF